ncbi:MAG TPA: hypothetical protein PLP21_12850 [Pyrinomonadaceae bacterium]|nr:hypothetical protein [Acidobacteriota bacterium]HQZ97202.1 hypothetical protein [Pyrinomonadaceae bacterium]
MPDTDEWQYEYVLPDKVHYTNIRTANGKVQRVEQIDIGKIKYCKKDDGVWKIVESYCIGGSGSGGPSNIVSDKYYLEKKKVDGREIKVFRHYTSYKNIYSPNKDTEGLSFDEYIFSLDSSGLIIKEETKKGLINSGKVIETNISIYTYDPKIKIQEPLK